jgi:hypothetical protein
MRKLKLYLEASVWNFYFADDAPEKMEVTPMGVSCGENNETTD